MTYQWSPEAEKCFTRVRLIGSGAFSSIWMAKPKETSEDLKLFCPVHSGPTPDSSDTKGNNACTMCNNVALKTTVINARDNLENALEYALREIAILKRLNHPHIMKVVKDFPLNNKETQGEPQDSQKVVYFSVALSLAVGPTVEQLVEKGGALGLPMAQHLARQLISTLSYMHNHAVIHRDIKPDNMIVTGAIIEDDANWCDDYTNPDIIKLTSPEMYGERRWHLIMVDFGFSRALSPTDISDDIGLYRAVHQDEQAGDEVPPDGDDVNVKRQKDGTPIYQVSLNQKLLQGKGAEWSKKRANLLKSNSISELRVLDMSALGNEHYAAPEVLRNLRRYVDRSQSDLDVSDKGNNESSTGIDHSQRSHVSSLSRSIRRGASQIINTRSTRQRHRRKPLGQNVADYGMVADAYSLGAVLRYMLTGVPPTHNVEEYIGLQDSPAALIINFIVSLFQTCKSQKNKASKDTEDDTGALAPTKLRKRRFKRNNQIPRDAASLVRSLTVWNEHKRLTVRAAKHHPWITGNKPNDPAVPEQPYVHEPIEFLDLDFEHDKKSRNAEIVT